MPDRPTPHDIIDRAVGLCSGCRHATVQRSAKGSAFWRCRAGVEREGMLRYPPLPVLRCDAFEAGAPQE